MNRTRSMQPRAQRFAVQVAVVVLLASLRFPQMDRVEARSAALDARIPELALRAGVPGVSLAMANAEGVVWERAFGARDAATDGPPVNADTVFEAASLSKPVFAYAVLQLVGEQVLDLDTPLIEYGPLRDIAHDPRHRAITARMVLSHSTGLPNWRQGDRLDLTSDPGAEWIYSGEGFVLLQRVVEELVGDTLQGLASSLVFEPLGMTRTSFVWNADFASNIALPHDEAGASRPANRLLEPNAAYSLLTTASDYARFLSALLRGEALTEELHAMLFRPVVDVNTGVEWGGGVGLERHDDGRAFWHWGHNGGYRAFMIGYPARGTAFVYFSNSDNGMRFLRDLVTLGTGDKIHPAIDHLNYESYEPPAVVGD